MKNLLIILLCAFLSIGASASRDCDGSNDRIDVEFTENMYGTGAKSVFYWFAADAWDTGVGDRIIVLGDNYSGTGNYWIHAAEDNGTSLDVGGGRLIMEKGNLSNQEWYGAGWTFPGSDNTDSILGYINGVSKGISQENGSAQTVNTSDAADADGLCAKDSGAFNFNGKLTYVQVWSRELSHAEIANVTYLPGSISDSLEAFWALWGVDSPEIDLSENNNTGIVSGASSSNDGPPVMFGGGLPL